MNIAQLAKLAAQQDSEGAKPSLSFSNNPVSNFLRGDDKGLDWRWGTLGSFVNPVIPAHKAYTTLGLEGFLNSYPGNVGGQGHDLANKLERFAKSKKFKFMSSPGVTDYGAAPGFDVMGRKYNAAIIHGPNRNASAIAHEIGHALAPKWVFNPSTLRGVQTASGLGSGLGTLGALMSRDETNSRRAALAGTAANLPLLGVELDASIRGANILRRLGARSGMGAFVGLPTYALAAAMPLGAHYTKKLLGGFEHKKTV